MRYLAIARAGAYSVNMRSLDEAIFNDVILGLQAKGHTVDRIREELVGESVPPAYDAVITMARNVRRLTKFRTSLPCFNSIQGILACSHKALVASIFDEHGIPQPRHSTADGTCQQRPPYPLWAKRGNGCAETETDTVYVRNEDELHNALQTMQARGIDECLLQEHAQGDLVKFYGVEGTDFFHWLYADPTHSKFGLEALNSQFKGYPFAPNELKDIADQAARALGVQVYGGDCIITPQGGFSLIDFNDWPSFYCCRDEAARAIVARVSSPST